MSKVQILILDQETVENKELVEPGDHPILDFARSVKDRWIVAIAGESPFDPLSIAISEMQSCMKLVEINYNGFICNDPLGVTCWHVHSAKKVDFGSLNARIRDVAHPLHENHNCKNLIGLFAKPNLGITQHVIQHYALQRLPLECLMVKSSGNYLITHHDQRVTVQKVELEGDRWVSRKKLFSTENSDFRSDPHLWSEIARVVG